MGRSVTPSLGGPTGAPGEVHVTAVSGPTPTAFAARWTGDGGEMQRFDGVNWTSTLDDRFAYSSAVDPSDLRHIVATSHDLPYHDVVRAGGVWESFDGGSTWRRNIERLPVMRLSTIAIDPYDGGRIVVGSVGGGFYAVGRPRDGVSQKGDR